MILDCHNRIYIITRTSKRKPPQGICKVYFSNKAVDFVNLPSILYSPILVSLLKYLPSNFVTPAVVYNLQNL